MRILEYNKPMMLKGILVAEEAIKKDENLAVFLHKVGGELEIVSVNKQDIKDGEILDMLTSFKLSKEEVLLLCPDNDYVRLGKEQQIAVLAYADMGGFYSFPDADFVMEGIQFLSYRDLVRRYQRQKGLPWQIAETQRLIIREETPDDVEELIKIYESPSIRKYLEPLFEVEKEKAYLANYYKYIYSFFEYGLWHLELKDSHETIGRAGLTPKSYDDGEKGAELGYMIAEKYQGQGYCMEACREIVRYAIEELELEQIYCLVRPDNEHSIRIAEKLGFVYEKESFSEGRTMKRYILKLYH